MGDVVKLPRRLTFREMYARALAEDWIRRMDAGYYDLCMSPPKTRKSVIPDTRTGNVIYFRGSDG